MNRTFTAEEDRIIVDGRTAGLPWDSIGQQIGATGKCCQYRLTRGLGLLDPKVVQVGRSKERRDYDNPDEARLKRPPLPAGDAATWRAITAGTVLDGRAFR
ncbi:hypothetical protein HN018_26770 (plasmid) [Lichenicola cladoniae]|uniref:Uncharacterized protein n=1 Tax=Lichenicola cladoniae TaxID=1484109 RepID=A0A6M8HZW0_9PROT|nr:hypothetical protein [Lichenicola cladoniae]NPD66625.1 hypothetical protein [Acetobacteraceae bacterium]QKE93737.1 hypothetical protein HN018_26770 [Lichenicola cladoniae]